MNPLRAEAILQRIDQLLEVKRPRDDKFAVAFSERRLGTISLMVALYGAGSPQEQHMQAQTASWAGLQGLLQGMKAEIEAGLVGNIERRAAGEVLGDMLALAKEAMAIGTDDGKNVAAVLTAAGYEDTIRKMGDTLANVQGRPQLAEVITALKNADVLVGASLTTGLGFLKFRNDAMHADWAKIDRVAVGSC